MKALQVYSRRKKPAKYNKQLDLLVPNIRNPVLIMQDEHNNFETIKGLEIFSGRCLYHPSGVASTGRLADLITIALKRARIEAVRDMLVNIGTMFGFESPGPAYRRWAARRWASALGPDIRLAMVARPEHICPEKTGLLVAAEEGLNAYICDSESEALEWLDARRTMGTGYKQK